MDIKPRPRLIEVDRHEIPQEHEPTVLQRIYITFESTGYLNEYMASPVRERLMRRLRPLLVSDLVQSIQHSNAFHDLTGQQGQSTADRPLWKVWWITVMALYMTV